MTLSFSEGSFFFKLEEGEDRLRKMGGEVEKGECGRYGLKEIGFKKRKFTNDR